MLECDRPPPREITEKVADDCGVPRENVTFIFAPTQSLAGSVQVVARVLEVALHKAHELKFPLTRIIDGVAAAPLSPPHPDFVQAMGRTNDAIIYGGQAHLFVTGPADRCQGAGGTTPEHDVARLWASLRRGVQGLQGRFLYNRSDAVQPGPRHCDGGRDRRDVSRGQGRSRIARCLFRIGNRRRARLWTDPKSRSLSIFTIGMRAILAAAFARAGAAAVPIRLAQCGFDTRRPSGLVIPGFGADLPDAVFVRAIGSGTFESVTLRLDVLHSLAAIGVPVFNSARAVEICVDKAATSFALARHGLPTPPTWTVQSEQAARQIVRREAGRGPLVLKPLFGAQGFGLKLIRREDDLPPSKPSKVFIIFSDSSRSNAMAFATSGSSSRRGRSSPR